MSDPLRLYGLKSIVLNAADGIGEAVARTLVKHGAAVVAIDTRNSGVEQHFANVRGITGQVAPANDPAALPAAFDAAVETLGGIDILVNDFPLHPEAPIEQADETLERLLNTRAALITSACRAATPSLRKSPQGRVINVGFLRSYFSMDGGAAYQEAQRDLAELTTELAADMGEHAISVNYIQPGAVMTPQSREVFRKDTAFRDHCMKISVARRLGEPLDVAKVALFLASDDAAFVSGTGVAVDGGMTAST